MKEGVREGEREIQRPALEKKKVERIQRRDTDKKKKGETQSHTPSGDGAYNHTLLRCMLYQLSHRSH